MLSERLPLGTASPFSDSCVSVKEFYQEALAAILEVDGLIHGKLNEGKDVCAVGAVNAACKKNRMGIVASREVITALQQVNDSVPDASPAERKRIVVEWLKGKIGEES